MNEAKKKNPRLRRYLKGMGWGAFIFFLVKGLIWLAVFFGAGKLFI